MKKNSIIFDIYIWQIFISPHIAPLALALSKLGHNITFVVQNRTSKEREAQGWIEPELFSINLVIANTKKEIHNIVNNSPEKSIHICPGIRGNEKIQLAQKSLAKLMRRQWIIMETVKESKYSKLPKRLIYRFLFSKFNNHIDGILSIGKNTRDWISERGVPPYKIYPFAYFLDNDIKDYKSNQKNKVFRFIYVGRLIELKRVDLLIDALSLLDKNTYELLIIGDGPTKEKLEKISKSKNLPIKWMGQIKQTEVPKFIATSDCLVLPSNHDGWGAVISESLMVGTPVICSDTCGASLAVTASNFGSVFKTGDILSLKNSLFTQVNSGTITSIEREKISEWANCLGAEFGANYLIDIFEKKYTITEFPPSRKLD